MSSPTLGTHRMSRLVRSPQFLSAIVLVIVTVAVGVNVVTAAEAGVGVVGYVAIVTCASGVALGLRYPYAGLCLVSCAAPISVLGGLVTTGVWSIACFAAFLFTLRGASALIVGSVIAVSNFAAAGWEAGSIDVTVDSTASIAAFAAVVSAAIGSAIRGNLRYRSEVEYRMRENEANRMTAVERGIAQERLRIARDLHDSIGHHVAVVSMRLGAAEVHLPSGAEASREDLVAARAGVQAVLRETQQILRVLRDESSNDLAARLLRPLPDLVASYRDAGMEIESSIDELPEALAVLGRAAIYRVVQEGLTNAQKHGTGAVSVMVRQHVEHTYVELVNRCSVQSCPEDAQGGNGLIGMRERAESVGGVFNAHTDGRMFWLTAYIPSQMELR